jgi:hypothetical protein
MLFLNLVKGLLFQHVNNLKLNRNELNGVIVIPFTSDCAECFCVFVYCLFGCSLSNWLFLPEIKFTGKLVSAYLGK